MKETSQVEKASSLFGKGTFPREGRSVTCGLLPKERWLVPVGQNLSPVKAETGNTEKANLEQPHTGCNTAWGQERVRAETYQQVGTGSALHETQSLSKPCTVCMQLPDTIIFGEIQSAP